MKTKNALPSAGMDPGSAAISYTVYHLKVHIVNILPMIYQRFIIDGNTHLAELHHLI